MVLGAAGALALTRLMASLLYEVTPDDPVVLALTCAGALLAAVAACYMPAGATTKVDPAVTLRAT